MSNISKKAFWILSGLLMGVSQPALAEQRSGANQNSVSQKIGDWELRRYSKSSCEISLFYPMFGTTGWRMAIQYDTFLGWMVGYSEPFGFEEELPSTAPVSFRLDGSGWSSKWTMSGASRKVSGKVWTGNWDRTKKDARQNFQKEWSRADSFTVHIGGKNRGSRTLTGSAKALAAVRKCAER